MNQIKSLLRNIKARTVSFFKAPYLQLHSSLWDNIHDEAICLVEDKLDLVGQSLEKADLAHKLRGEFITSSDVEDELNDSDTITALECDISRLQDDKLNTNDFDYELSQAYSFTELSDKVDELEANSDMDYTDIGDECHPISRLIDARTEQIHSLILEVKGKVDEPYEPNIKYLVSELQKAVQDEADISVFAYLVESLYNKVADNG